MNEDSPNKSGFKPYKFLLHQGLNEEYSFWCLEFCEINMNKLNIKQILLNVEARIFL